MKDKPTADSQSRFSPTPNPARRYAVLLDLVADADADAHGEVTRFLESRGFSLGPGGLYVCDSPVACVLAIMDLARQVPWFAASVRSARMLRIEETEDLMEAVRWAAGP